MNNSVEAVNALCDRFGTTFPRMVEELSKVAYAEFITGIIIGLLFLGVFVFLLYIMLKWHIEDDEQQLYLGIGIVVFGLVGSVTFFVCLVDLIGWIASPSGATMDYIITHLN